MKVFVLLVVQWLLMAERSLSLTVLKALMITCLCMLIAAVIQAVSIGAATGMSYEIGLFFGILYTMYIVGRYCS